MFEKNSPEHRTQMDSDDEDDVHIDPNDALEVIDIDPSNDPAVEAQLDDLDVTETMEG